MTYEISNPNIISLIPSYNLEIPKISSTISYEYFFENFLLPNHPCIITNISENWPASKKWIKNGVPNFSFLLENYSKYDICISNCNERYFNAQKTKSISFDTYINYWQNYVENNYSNELPSLYLKDWHLKKGCDENFYTIPVFFASDWLNEYFSEKTDDDYMFVYMGPKGTWTPFHVDVFTSYSWSTNICGKKKWILFPPGEETNLKDTLGNLPYDVITSKYANKKYIQLDQNSGEAIFVPSGWHHQVWNLEDTISINHNWINGCNVKNMWFSITDNLNAVKKEIADCKDMDNWLNQCQIMLKASHGIDFQMFYHFLYHIGSKRLKILKKKKCSNVFEDWIIGENHALFDLNRIKEVLELFVKHEDFNNFSFSNKDLNIAPQEFLLNIDDYMLKCT